MVIIHILYKLNIILPDSFYIKFLKKNRPNSR